MAQDDPPVRGADTGGCLDIFLILDRQNGSSDHAGVARDLRDGDGDDQIHKARLQHRRQRDGQQHARNGHENIHQAHQDVIDLTAVVAGDSTQQTADNDSHDD